MMFFLAYKFCIKACLNFYRKNYYASFMPIKFVFINDTDRKKHRNFKILGDKRSIEK